MCTLLLGIVILCESHSTPSVYKRPLCFVWLFFGYVLLCLPRNETGRMPHFGLYHVGMQVRLTQTLEAPYVVVDTTGTICKLWICTRRSWQGRLGFPFRRPQTSSPGYLSGVAWCGAGLLTGKPLLRAYLPSCDWMPCMHTLQENLSGATIH